MGEDATVAGNVLTNDLTGDEANSDSTDLLSVTSANAVQIVGSAEIQGEFGTVTISPDGNFSYHADADILDALPAGTDLTDTFDYAISDGNGRHRPARRGWRASGRA